MSPCCFRKSARGAHMSTFCSAAQVVVVLLARTLCAADNFSEKFLAAETRNGPRRGAGGKGEGGVRRRTWRAAQLEIGNFWMSLLSKSYNLNVICNCKKGDSRTEPYPGRVWGGEDGDGGLSLLKDCRRVCVTKRRSGWTTTCLQQCGKVNETTTGC